MRFEDLPRRIARMTVVDEVRTHPQFYRCSPQFALAHSGGDLRLAIQMTMAALTRPWKYVSIDTRVAMLMPGMYPSIPGWHCDDFWRPTGEQPDLHNAPPAEHIAIVFGTASLTRYVMEPLDLYVPDAAVLAGRPLYGVMHEAIEARRPSTVQVLSGEAWRFTQWTWHRAEPATERGWRCFFRLTGSDHREPRDEIRTQTQVYLTNPFGGW